MTAPNDDSEWNRLGTLVRAEQARVLKSDDELLRLEAAAERLGARAIDARRPRRRAGFVWVGGFAAAALVVLAVVAWRPRALSFDAGGAAGHLGVSLAANQQALPLQFSDGSILMLAPASEGEVLALSARGATVSLRTGHLDAAVVHAPGARWTVGVGPYVIHVTGTRFSVAWDRDRQRLRVALTTGGVTVQGPLLGGTGLPMTPGQALSVDLGQQRVSLAPLGDEQRPPAVAPPATRPPRVPPPPEAPPAVEVSEWKRWALASDPARAYAAAAQVGIETLCRQLPPADLLLLADTARFAGMSGAAMKTFQALRARFPDDARAGDAVFGMGVLALDADHQPLRATRRFQEYVARWPEGALAREAQGRLIEALEKASHPAEARRAAARYLDRYGDGPHAALARQVLRRDPS